MARCYIEKKDYDKAIELCKYVTEFWKKINSVWNNRISIWKSKKNSTKKIAKNCEQIVFPIEDPFDIEHNPGTTLKFNTQQHSEFFLCMQKEINNILSGEYFKYIKH